MGKIILHLNITPDGFCDHRSSIADTEMMKSVNKLLGTVDKALFGRSTFQLFENYWPLVWKNKKDSEHDIIFSGIMENMEKIVFTKTLTGSDWNHTRIVNELNKQEILKMKDQGKDILVFGSPGLAGQLIELDLIDDFYFLVQPFISRAGPRLFNTDKLKEKRKLHFKNAENFDSGTVILSYSFK
jgi:dihydrofolate reductase